MLFDHIPLIVGAGLVGAVHQARASLIRGSGPWMGVLDVFLLIAEFTLLGSLVATKGLELVGEIVETAVIVGKRIAQTGRTGQRLPPSPRP